MLIPYSMSTTNVSIIGAGLSGLALALALQQQSNVCTLYEARPATLDIGGALMLTPNALRILDSIGIYARLKDNGYSFESSTSLPRPQAVDSYEFGGEAKYGYPALRIYRRVLTRELSALVEEAGIPIVYNK